MFLVFSFSFNIFQIVLIILMPQAEIPKVQFNKIYMNS